MFTALVMVLLAVFFDGLQDFFLLFNLIPIVGFILSALFSWLVTIFSTVIFGLWFFLCGVSYTDRKAATKLLIILSSVVVELIPIIDALPAITFGVVALIIVSRIEDYGMRGPRIAQTLAGAGQIARAVGVPGRGAATKALRSGEHEDGTPFNPSEYSLDLRMGSAPHEGE